MALSKAAACLTVALILATAGPGSAQFAPQSTPQSVPAQTPPQAPPVAQPKPEPAPPPSPRQRPTKRSPRTSKRQPSPSGQGSFDATRTSRDGGPTRQELTFTANVLGGYDDNLTAGLGTGSGTAPASMASGSGAFLDGTLGYFRGNALHSIRTDSTGSLTAYPGYLDHPAPGGVVNVDARTTVGRNWTIGASERVGYEPLFNVLSPGASGTPLPPGIGEAVPATGLFERQSWSSNTSASIDRRWSREDSTALSYSYRVQQFTDDDYGDNSSHRVTADCWRSLSPGFRAGAKYRYENGEYIDSAEFPRPMLQHRIEGGAETDSALSRRRHLMLSLAAGAGYIQSIGSTTREPYRAWVPTGSGSLILGLSPTSSVEGGYQRDFSLFQGVTDEVYTTDTAYLTTGGFVTSRTDLRVGATYSNWKTPVASGVNDTLNVYGAWLQVRVALTETVAATAGYYYYHQRYSNPADLPDGFPAEYNRNAVRVGLTVWVPLAGTPSRPPLTQR